MDSGREPGRLLGHGDGERERALSTRRNKQLAVSTASAITEMGEERAPGRTPESVAVTMATASARARPSQATGAAECTDPATARHTTTYTEGR